MNAGAGVALIVAGSILGLFTLFGLWRRLPGPAAFVLLAAAGAVLGAGALLVQEGATPADWAVTLLVLGGSPRCTADWSSVPQGTLAMTPRWLPSASPPRTKGGNG